MNGLQLVFAFAVLFSSSSAFHASVKNDDVNPPIYCIIFEGNVSGSIEYEHMNSTKTSSYPFHLDESTLNVSGTCLSVEHNKSVEAIAIEFLPEGVPALTGQWRLEIQFENDKDNTFRVAEMSLFVKLPDSLNSSAETVKYTLDKQEDLWSVTDRNGYTCSNSPFNLAYKTTEPQLKATVIFELVKVLAFAQLATDQFPNDQVFEMCDLDTKTSDVVPIVVGACLAGLVVVVLVAYLVGRARSRRQGYASV